MCVSYLRQDKFLSLNMRITRGISLLAGILLPIVALAQTSVWETPKNAANIVSKQATKTVGTLQRWKNHLTQWGLDSNYKHYVGAGLHLNTNGIGGLIEYKQHVSTGKYNYIQLTFAEVKHEKQVKQEVANTSYPELGQATPFVYGKINNLYQLQLGIGREQLLLPSVLDGNISISFRCDIGVSVAMLKPYYLRLIHVDYIPVQVASMREQKYSDDNGLFLQRGSILGASKWSKGLDEIQFIAGCYINGACILEPAKNKIFVQTVAFGGQFALYPRKLSIMAERDSYPFAGCLYVELSLGKRWK